MQEIPFRSLSYIVTMWLQFGFSLASIWLQFSFSKTKFKDVLDLATGTFVSCFVRAIIVGDNRVVERLATKMGSR